MPECWDGVSEGPGVLRDGQGGWGILVTLQRTGCPPALCGDRSAGMLPSWSFQALGGGPDKMVGVWEMQ